MSVDVPFTKINLEFYLKELAKEYKKRAHGVKAEMILVGGASVLINYDFRSSSYDIDAAYPAYSVMKEAINAVGDKFGLQNGWINDDFKKTASYTPKIMQYSVYYKTFSGVLELRTVKAEYLIAMKLMSGRRYKKDLSDIAGILYEQTSAGDPLSRERIDRAVNDLYGGWTDIPEYSVAVLERVLACDDPAKLFIELRTDETDAKETLTRIHKKYPGAVTQDNIDDVIAAALNKKDHGTSGNG